MIHIHSPTTNRLRLDTGQHLFLLKVTSVEIAVPIQKGLLLSHTLGHLTIALCHKLTPQNIKEAIKDVTNKFQYRWGESRTNKQKKNMLKCLASKEHQIYWSPYPPRHCFPVQHSLEAN